MTGGKQSKQVESDYWFEIKFRNLKEKETIVSNSRGLNLNKLLGLTPITI